MGRKNKKYVKTLHQQAYQKFIAMQAFGQSKAEAKRNGTDRDKIFSFATYQTYWKHAKYFIKWVQNTYPECTTLKNAKKHVNEWLQMRVDQGLSAWTVQTEMAALCKLYQIAPDDKDRFQPPKRRRQDIKRSRVETVRDKHFSVTNNDELIKFVCATGTRRNVLEKLKGKDLWSRQEIEDAVQELETKNSLNEQEKRNLDVLKDALHVFPEQTYFIQHCQDKNGRYRFAPVVGTGTGLVLARMQKTEKEELVWKYVNSNADIHGYRSEYAVTVYKMYARDLQDIPYDRVNKGTGKKYQSEVYCCRKDEAGKKLDKAAMYKCSKALGHNRLNVVADNYLRNL